MPRPKALREQRAWVPQLARRELERARWRAHRPPLTQMSAQDDPRLLLQIFSEALIGPVFFEFIQRKRDEGFGEGNFKALFESMERDQLQRGSIESRETG